MQIAVTIQSAENPDAECDVRLSACGELSASALARLVNPLVGCASDALLCVDGRPLSPTMAISEQGIRAGAHFRIGEAGAHRPTALAGLQLRVIGGGDAGRLTGLVRGILRIGRSEQADFTIEDPDVSRMHAELRLEHDGMWLRDLGSSNGTHVGAERLRSSQGPLKVGTVFRIGTSSLVVTSNSEPPARTSDAGGVLLIHRSTTPTRPIVECVDFPEQPVEAARPTFNFASALVPTLLAVALALAMRNPQLLAFALLTPVTMLSTTASDLWTWRRKRRSIQRKFLVEEETAERALAEAVLVEQEQRHRRYPDAATIAVAAASQNARIFERHSADADFLRLRLGLADDDARCRGRRGATELPPPLLASVPATLSVAEGPIGVAGPVLLARGSVRWLIAQLVTLHSPNNLLILLISTAANEWRWLRWLPGFHSVTCDRSGAASLVSELLDVARARSETPSGQGTWHWMLLLIESDPDLTSVDGLDCLLATGPKVGITAIIIADHPRTLPPACAAIAAFDPGDSTTMTITPTAGSPIKKIIADRVSSDFVEALARGLAPLRDAVSSDGGGLPAEVRLTDLLELSDVSPSDLAIRWRSDVDTKVRLGVTRSGPLEVDLIVDGPHALIAGCTGSGKSELLRSLVISLAACNAPDELAFVLIDYKGGAAFADCASLPHACALITDLDHQSTRRALRSLDAELRRRETALASVGVTDLASYRRSDKALHHPIARLVLVVDEFASLADELPGFLDGLLGIAQRGRSLGVHLVLATQRPAGVVSAQMRANIPLRIALRVTDSVDSIDMIGTEHAARIPKGSPGRGYALLAKGLVEFQAARIGLSTAAAGTPAVQLLDEWNRASEDDGSPDASETDLTQFCQATMKAARAAGSRTMPPPWLPALPDRITIEELRARGDDLSENRSAIPLALVDDPEHQAQYLLAHELSEGGAIGFIGGPRSGRTTALRTLIAAAADRHDPDELHCHVIDCSSGSLTSIAALPHCGSVLSGRDAVTVVRLIERLKADVSERQRSITSLGFGSAAEARSAGNDIPWVILAVDGWEGLLSLSEELDGGRTIDTLLTILREASSVGYTVLIAGDRSLLATRAAATLGRRFVFNLLDRNDFALAGLPGAAVPSTLPPGRALMADTACEAQFPLLDPDPATACQLNRMNLIAAGSAPPTRANRIAVRPLPERVGGPDAPPLTKDQQPILGVGGDGAEPVSVDLFGSNRRLLITGPGGSGRSTALITLGMGCLALGHPLLVVAGGNSPLTVWAQTNGLDLRVDLDTAECEPLFEFCRAHVDRGLVLVDDVASSVSPLLSESLTEIAARYPGAVAVATRSEDLLMSYRGIAKEMARFRSGLLLRPSNAEREAFGMRLSPSPGLAIPGRGVLVTDAGRSDYPDGIPVQVTAAMPASMPASPRPDLVPGAAASLANGSTHWLPTAATM